MTVSRETARTGDTAGPRRGGMPDRPDLAGLLERASRALRAGRIDELVAHTRTAVAILPHEHALTLRVGSLLQAAYRFTGDGTLRRLALETCGRVADGVDRPAEAVPARALMGNIHMLHGAFHPALEHCDAALDLAASTGLHDAPGAAMAHQFRGYLLFEWNRLHEAEAALVRAWEGAGESRGIRSGTARMLAHVLAARGDARADAWLERLDSVMTGPRTLRNREWLAAVRAGHTLGRSRLREAEAWLRTFDYRPETLATLPAAAVHARLQEYDRVLALFEATAQWPRILAMAPTVRHATHAERPWFAARAATSEAVALEATRRPADADARFADALDLGDAGSFVRVYVEGSPLRYRLLERSGRLAARRVLAALTAPPAPLTPAQTLVLRHVAEGASNKSIARDLGVSLSTVKTHLRAVFGRLDVSSRTQAVARARERGILPV